MNRLGIDAGSKTVKLVILNEMDQTVFSQYRLHKSDILSTTRELIHDTRWRFGDAELSVCVTGSAGIRLAELLGLPFEQEVVVCRHAIERLYPQADVVIELGGEDAKIIYLTDGVEQRMNGSCAGGTGGFIDQMAGMLGVRAREFNALALGYQTIYPIASRCAVFAQTDVRPLLNEGARRSDIAASVLQAVVTQTIAGLSCGRPIKGTVVFLGGPIETYSTLLFRFRQTLDLSHEQTIKPSDAHLFIAKAAALKAAKNCHTSLKALEDKLAAAPLEEDGGIERLPPLFPSMQDLAEFQQRHSQSKVARRQLMAASGDVFVGIDAGSTTVKLAVIDSAGALLYSDYQSTRGDVVQTTRTILTDLYASLPREYDGEALTTIRSTTVCGYGEQMLRVAFSVDKGVVETIAHLRAARELDPEVDFVLDIGGQDIKCLRIKNGAIDDIMLNEACSSGCGALIEGFSRTLGCTVWSFSAAALNAQRPVDLGTRCTVFMTSRVRHAQKSGASLADIAAGLAYSVVRNALHKVIGCTDPASLGTHIVVQGGTFLSDAVLRAFELESGLEVRRPDIAHLMGAYGCALLARDAFVAEAACGNQTSALIKPTELASLKQTQSMRRCAGCENNCLLTVSSFAPSPEAESAAGMPLAARTFITGNRCERPLAAVDFENGEKLPNLFMVERELLTHFGSVDRGTSPDRLHGRPRVGIPAVLDLYQTRPFWQTFYCELGCEPMCLETSSSAIYRSAAQAVMSEGLCYPAKLAHGHAAQLVFSGSQYLFMPSGGSVDQAPHSIECPVSGNYASLIAEDAHAMQTLEGHPVGFLSCDIANAATLAQQLMASIVGCGLAAQLVQFPEMETIEHALHRAHLAQQNFSRNLADQTKAVLEQIEQEELRAIVLAGHPYHTDVGLSHGIDELLSSLGFAVLSSSGILAYLDLFCDASNSQETIVSGDKIAEHWTQPQALYRVAQFVANHPQLELVQLYSFGCGVDALSIGQVRTITEDAGKLYTALKVDEMVDLAAIRVRLRSLKAALDERKVGRRTGRLSDKGHVPVSTLSTASSTPTIIMPAIAPQHLQAITAVIAEAGYELQIMAPISPADIAQGLRSYNNDLCYPMLALAGQVIAYLQTQKDKSYSPLIIPQVCCGCRSIELAQLVRSQLRQIGNTSEVEVIGLPSMGELFTMPAWLATRIYDVLEGLGSREGTFGLLPNKPNKPKPNGTDPAQDPSRPRIGVVGNAALLYTPQLNHKLIQQIEAEGCEAVMPPITELLVTNAPLEQQVVRFVEAGIYDIIIIQSFGCLSGHIHGRGAARRIRQRYPQVNLGFIEYDAGTSKVNQTNRLKLAATIAKERVL